MRWTKIAFLLLVVVVFALSFANIYPLAAPLIAHHQTKGMVSVILNDLITPHQQTGLGQYYSWMLLAAIAVTWLIVTYDLRTRKRSTHGTARPGTNRDARKYHGPRSLPKLPQPGRALALFSGWRAAREFRFLLGKYHGKTISLSEKQQYEHMLLTAPTGAGKSARVFVPNLLRETGSRSLFIGDLKNELYKITAGWLAQSMQVWLFAPLRRDSQGYNPLAHIKSVEDAQDFAETWVANTGGDPGKDGDFWTNNAKLLITAMTLHLVVTERTPALSRLADLLTTSSFKEIQAILNGTRSPDARRLARQFLANMEQNERLVGSVLTDVGVRFQLLASRQARAVTATNDIDFQEMIRTPTALFLTIPQSETKRYRPLMAVMTHQMFTTWERAGTNGIRCYLDEFTNLGHIPGYANFISTARSLKVSLLMAIQNFSQLDERYGKNEANTIKANAVTHLLLPGAGLEETKYYSERIGDTTVATETINRRGNGEITSTQGETRRRLITPDELRTMPEDEMLLLEAKSAPLMLKTTLYFKEKGYDERANITYQGPTRVQQTQEPPTAAATPPRSTQSLPPAPSTGQAATSPPIIVESDQDDDLFFPQE